MTANPQNSKSGKKLGIGASLAVGAAGLVALSKYRQAHQAFIAELEQNSQTAVTKNGVIEYAIAGEGTPVLVTHGTIGGYDQGLAIVQPFLNQGFQFITVSRAGYLRSEPSTGTTAEIQADTYAQLLDILDIPQAAIIGVSGGAPSALHFALRHPNRCSGLIIMSGISKEAPPLPPMIALNVRLQAITMRIDWPWWLMVKTALPVLMLTNGVDKELVQQIMSDPKQKALISRLYEPAATPSLRLKGTSIDDDHIQGLTPLPVETLSMPVLVVHSPTDPLIPMEQAEWLSDTVQNGRLLTIADGGHPCFLVRHHQVVPEVTHFLQSAASETGVSS